MPLSTSSSSSARVLRRRTWSIAALSAMRWIQVSSAASPESEYACEALGRDLSTAMNRLSAMERQAFLLKHIEGWRLDEIAESLQTTINGVKHTLFRATRKLRTDLHVWRGES